MRRFLALFAGCVLVVGLAPAAQGADPVAPTLTRTKIESGPMPDGTKVRIDGKGFAGGAEVNFGDTPARAVEVVSNSRIYAWTPETIVPGSAAVTITTSGGTSDPIDFTYPGWLSASAGAFATCAVRSDGTLWCWGHNYYGLFGSPSGEIINSPLPIRVGTATNWQSVSVGSAHACAIQTSGSLWCWGTNSSGELGLGNFTQQTAPARVGSRSDWKSVAVYQNSATCAIRDNGTLWCWGTHLYGANGLGTSESIPTPTKQPGGGFTDVSAGIVHGCALKTDSTAWCWGRTHGDGPNLGARPSRLASTYLSISAGGETVCGVRTNGRLWCGGGNHFGAVGVGDTTHRDSMVRVSTATDWSSVATGLGPCALRASATWCWGMNTAGLLGDGTTTDRLAPALISDGPWARHWPAQGHHRCSTHENGTLWCTGSNAYGQLGLGDNDTRLTRTRIG